MDSSFTQQLLDALHIRNYDDRDKKLGARTRDIAGAALENMTRSRDRHIMRYALAHLPGKEVMF